GSGADRSTARHLPGGIRLHAAGDTTRRLAAARMAPALARCARPEAPVPCTGRGRSAVAVGPAGRGGAAMVGHGAAAVATFDDAQLAGAAGLDAGGGRTPGLSAGARGIAACRTVA